MNDAGDNHSTRLPWWLRSPLPDDGDLTPAQAIREFGPPELVAEMDRLVEIETARLFPPPPPPQPAGATEWDRHVVELIRQYPGEPEKVTAELNRRMAAPVPGEREWNLELTRVATESELQACQAELWRYLKAEGTAGRLHFSYQPPDPAAARVTITSDRCRYLAVLSPGTLFEGALAIAIHCGRRNPARPDTLRLDGYELWHARIRSAPTVLGDAAGQSLPPRTRRKGGRAPHAYWPDVREVARTWMQDKGVPQPGDGRQAALESHIFKWLDKHKHKAGESTVRGYVSRWIEESAVEMKIKAGNSDATAAKQRPPKR